MSTEKIVYHGPPTGAFEPCNFSELMGNISSLVVGGVAFSGSEVKVYHVDLYDVTCLYDHFKPRDRRRENERVTVTLYGRRKEVAGLEKRMNQWQTER